MTDPLAEAERAREEEKVDREAAIRARDELREALNGVIRDMRSTALVAGQYSVECPTFDAEAEAAYAARLTEWAEKLAALAKAEDR